VVEPSRLDQGEGHVAVEAAVVRAVDDFAAALAEEGLDLVAAGNEGGGERGRRLGGGYFRWSVCRRLRVIADVAACNLDKAFGVRVDGIDLEDSAGARKHRLPVVGVGCCLGFIEKIVDPAVHAFAGHGSGG